MDPKYDLPDHVSLTELDDEAVLLDCNTGAYFGLNHVGLALVNLLRQGLSLSIAQQRVATDYDAPQQQVIIDTSALIDEMLARHLLVESKASADISSDKG